MKQIGMQEAFTKMVVHLRRQGRPSLTRRGACAYRGAGGTKCAVGALIEDEFYDPLFEGRRVNYLPVLEALEKSGVRVRGHSGMLELLLHMQGVHDAQYLPGPILENWEKQFSAVARNHGLQVPPLNPTYLEAGASDVEACEARPVPSEEPLWDLV